MNLRQGKPRNVCVRKREGWKKEPGKAFKK